MWLRTRDDDLGLQQRYPPPETPWTEQYAQSHRAFLSDMLDDDGITCRFSAAARLPRDYGVGLDERVVEYPWLLSRELGGRTLDAGSTLNHAHVLDRVLPHLESLHIVTLAPEPSAFVERGISYVFADLRELPFRDGHYDTVLSLSTLEHVGMDNAQYGSSSESAPDPDAELRLAVAELRRVLRPGGRLFVTVPYGRHEDHGWFRQFDAADVDSLLAMLECKAPEVTVYAYGRTGWQPSDLARAADSEYRDFNADPRPADDAAAAARAVACIAARW